MRGIGMLLVVTGGITSLGAKMWIAGVASEEGDLERGSRWWFFWDELLYSLKNPQRCGVALAVMFVGLGMVGLGVRLFQTD